MISIKNLIIVELLDYHIKSLNLLENFNMKKHKIRIHLANNVKTKMEKYVEIMKEFEKNIANNMTINVNFLNSLI